MPSVIWVSGASATDEPAFALRASDRFTPHLLMDYAARCEDTGQSDLATAARRYADQARRWQHAHPADAHQRSDT